MKWGDVKWRLKSSLLRLKRARPITRNIRSQREADLRNKIVSAWLINQVPKKFDCLNPFDDNKTAKQAGISPKSTLKDCIKYCDLAIKENPRGSYQWYMKGRCLIILKKDEGALKCFEKACSLEPNEGDYFLERSRAKMFLGDLNGALEDAKKSAKCKPSGSIELIPFYSSQLQDLGISYESTVIWPAKLIKDIESKLSLEEKTGP